MWILGLKGLTQINFINDRFHTRGLIIRLDELGQTFVVRLVMRLKYKDGHKTHYAFGRTFLRNTS